MKRVLLTGASGFIGRHCLPLLHANGYEIHAISSKNTKAIFPDVFWYQVDLLDSKQVLDLIANVKASHLLHLAWYVEQGKYWSSLNNLNWVKASLDLLHAFVNNGGKRIVMAGTCAEYNWEYGYLSEYITPLLPKTLYGVCKHALHTILISYAREASISAAWGRIFFVYGPFEYQSRLVPSIIRSLLSGSPALCTHGNQLRDFLYVEDVASAFVALLESDFRGAVNIGSGQPVSIRDIVTIICNKIGRPDLIRFGGIPTNPDEPYLLMADTRILKEDVKWTACYSLDTGLNKTIQWWKDNI